MTPSARQCCRLQVPCTISPLLLSCSMRKLLLLEEEEEEDAPIFRFTGYGKTTWSGGSINGQWCCLLLTNPDRF
ncbi:hypothetical protein BDV40DRAFT_263745, partial [Aspergillus tamarii]